MIRAIFVMALLLVSARAHAELKLSCPSPPPFQITTSVTVEPISEAFDGDQALFNQGAILAGKKELVPIFGVYQSSSGYAAYIDAVSNVTLGYDSVCTFPKEIRLSIFIKDRIFRFINSIVKGSCSYNVERIHHQRQADSDSRIIREFEPIYASRLRRDLSLEEVAPATSAFEGHVKLEERIAKSLEATRALMKREEDIRGAALNTPAEIEFTHSCN